MENLEDLSSSQVLKMKCPECLKLYFADPHTITERHPKFQCQNCMMRFWVVYPESLSQSEILGYPLDWMEEDDSSSHPGGFSCQNDKSPRISKRPQRCGGTSRETTQPVMKPTQVVTDIKRETVVAPRRKKRFPRIIVFIGLFCTALIVIGVLVPGFRNLVGIGVAGLFLSIAMHRFLVSGSLG